MWSDSQERTEQRELMEQATACVATLVERDGWNLLSVCFAINWEVRERIADSAADDRAFRAWYEEWRRQNRPQC